MRIKNFLIVAFFVCLANIVICQNDTTVPNTTSNPPDTTETSTSPDTTTSTTPETTTTLPTTTSTTTPTTTTPETITTTTISTTTTITTTQVPTTTSGPETETVFNFTVPTNSSLPVCLRAKFSLGFNIQYPAIKNETTQSNETVAIKVDSIDGYSGDCGDNSNTLTVEFRSGWKLFLNYTLNKNAYQLSGVTLDYKVNAELFPDVDPTYIGLKTVGRSDLKEFAANKGNSFKCTSESKVSIDQVEVDFKNYQGQPFMEDKSTDFDSAIECSADTTGDSKLVPIIVGSSLAVLVILVLVAYIIGRRKHRPGYQQV